MNKVELVAKVTKDLKEKNIDVNQTVVGQVVDRVFANIQDRLYQEEDVKIVDFGIFKTTKRAERTGRNPATGDAIQIPAKNAVSFKPAKALKEYVQD